MQPSVLGEQPPMFLPRRRGLRPLHQTDARWLRNVRARQVWCDAAGSIRVSSELRRMQCVSATTHSKVLTQQLRGLRAFSRLPYKPGTQTPGPFLPTRLSVLPDIFKDEHMMNSVIYTMLTGQLLAWRTDVSTCRGGQQEPRTGRAQDSGGSPFKNDLKIKTAKAGRDTAELCTCDLCCHRVRAFVLGNTTVF